MSTEDGISPWRNAKPRKPLSDYQTPAGKSPSLGLDVSSLSDDDLYQHLFQLGVEVGPIVASTRNLYRKKLEQALNGKTVQSPPSSDYKESTRMESSLDSSASLRMDLSGASPALFRGGEEKLGAQKSGSKANSSRSKQASFTKIRNVSRTVTPLQKKNRSNRKTDNSDSEGSSEQEDDQPSGSCQFVGDASLASNLSSSTMNNTMGSTAKMRNGNSSVKHQSSASSPATTSKVPPSQPPGSKTSSLCSCLGWVFVCALAMLVYAITLEGGQDHLLLSGTADQQTAQHWQHVRDVFRQDLKYLVTKFPNQTISTWKMISATLKSPMNSLPDYPGVLLLLSTPSSLPTANCLVSKLVELSSKSFSKPGIVPPPSSQLVIPAPSLPTMDHHTAKEQLTTLLHTSLSSWGATAITSLHHLHPIPALTLHAFADNSNAPYKQAVLILSISEEGGQDETSTVEKRAEKILAREWSKELGEDKVYALISRLVVSVAEVQKEDKEVLAMC